LRSAAAIFFRAAAAKPRAVFDTKIRRQVTGDAFMFQIWSAYSWIVRSLENHPEHATLMMAFRDQVSGSA
jgi:hypothetical protein